MATASIGSPHRTGTYLRPGLNTLRIERLTTLADLHRIQNQWNALLDATPTGTIFQTWEWTVSWYEAFERDAIDVLAAFTPDGRLVGLAPLGVGGIPVIGRRIRFLLGYRHSLTEYLDILVHPDFAEEATAAILGSWHKDARKWDLIVLSSIRADSPFLHQLAMLAPSFGLHVEEYWSGVGVRGSLAQCPDHYFASLSRKTRKTITNLANRLEREGYDAHVVEVTDPESLLPALEVFFELHERRANAELDPPHDSRYPTAIERGFLKVVATRLLAHNRLFFTMLKVDGRAVAAQISFIHHGTLYLCDTGYDPDWAWYGVMSTLTSRSIARAIEHRCTELDLLLGSDQSKLRWGGAPQPVVSLAIGNAKLRSRAVLAAHRLVRAVSACLWRDS